MKENPISRTLNERDLAYDRMGEQFESALSDYDTQRRVSVLIDEFLSDDMIKDKNALDVGCGLGFFSQRLHERGATVLACDLGPGLVETTREHVGCEAVVADACSLVDQFGRDAFDLVVSSECIEHTPDPMAALREMSAVVKPGGYLAVSTPNIVWSPVVKLASKLRLRPFDGYENFSSWRRIARVLSESGLVVLRQRGLHLYPFQFGMHSLSQSCDQHLQFLRGLMINICVLAQKPASDSNRVED